MPRTAQSLTPLANVIAERQVRAVFQPIVDLETMAVVAFEALARGPVGSELEFPDALFAAAVAEDLTVELDWECRRAAFEGALASDLHDKTTMFVNVEPVALGTAAPPGYGDLPHKAARRFRIMLEITERDICERPAELLATVRWARSNWWGVALDDVGAIPGSLALMPFLRPDVIKLDLNLIQDQPTTAIAEVMTAVLAEAERSGATILAEGIETPEHLAKARALGARLGQGYLLGRPAPLTPGQGEVVTPVPVLPRQPRAKADATPYSVVTAERSVARSTKGILVEMSKHLEAQAFSLSCPGVLLSAFQDAEHFTPATAQRYRALAGRCSLVGALGIGLDARLLAGVRSAQIEPGDPLAGEWSVVVVGAHYAAALVARDLGDAGAEADRRFDYTITHDRRLVLLAADTMMRRLLPN